MEQARLIPIPGEFLEAAKAHKHAMEAAAGAFEKWGDLAVMLMSLKPAIVVLLLCMAAYFVAMIFRKL